MALGSAVAAAWTAQIGIAAAPPPALRQLTMALFITAAAGAVITLAMKIAEMRVWRPQLVARLKAERVAPKADPQAPQAPPADDALEAPLLAVPAAADHAAPPKAGAPAPARAANPLAAAKGGRAVNS